MLTATQTVLADYYAKGTDPKTGRKNDGDVTTPFATEIRKIADDDPYMVMVGIGDGRDADITEHDKYTAYFVMYWESPDKEPLFYSGGDWSLSYPWAKGESNMENNYFYVNGTKKCLTFVFIANKSGKTNPWPVIQQAIEKGNRGYAESGSTKK